jgi:hypothetical protein
VIIIHSSLIDFKNDALTRIQAFQGDRDLDELLTALINDLNDMLPGRMDYTPILERMFKRLNTNEDGSPKTEQLDTRPTSEAFDTLAPTAMSIADLSALVEILRAQVYVLTATGTNLDDFGRDFGFHRFEETHAFRRGETYNNRMERFDFPIDSRFLAPNTGNPNLAFIFESTENGDAIYKSETP